MVNVLEVAKKAAQEKGETGIWAVIIAAVSYTTIEIAPEVINYFVTGDIVSGIAYGAGLIIGTVVMAVVIEGAGEMLIKKE